MRRYLILLPLALCFACGVSAQTIIQDRISTIKARVVEVESEAPETTPGMTASGFIQQLKVEILEGSEKGRTVEFQNDYLRLSKGETFYLHDEIDGQSGIEMYSVSDAYRLPEVGLLVLFFIALVFIFGGLQGIRGLASLAGSLLLIAYVLLPGILHGFSPIFMSVGVSALIIVVGSYVTHGFNRTTTSAVCGMIVTVLLTSGLAFAAVHFTHLSGFTSEDNSYLSIDTRGSIDMLGLLLGGMLIGLLGVLYDVAIGQAISVEELHRAAPHLSKKAIYARAIRIGREHIGALVNTLAIAYVGVSLPLLLLFYSANTESLFVTLNREVFSTEIVRTMIGSIGLVLAVPVTTFIAAYILIGRVEKADRETLEREKHALEHAGHHH